MDVIERLQSHSIKPSVQRIAIMQYLMDHHTHPTVDEIYTALAPGMPTLSKTTVYNTLKSRHLPSTDEIPATTATPRHMPISSARCATKCTTCLVRTGSRPKAVQRRKATKYRKFTYIIEVSANIVRKKIVID